MNLTLGIIKPDVVFKKVTGKISDRIISEGFKIRAMKLIRLIKRQTEGFYAVHKGKAFFEELTDFMSSDSCVVVVLEKDRAV